VLSDILVSSVVEIKKGKVIFGAGITRAEHRGNIVVGFGVESVPTPIQN
jgi:hypothetical protein